MVEDEGDRVLQDDSSVFDLGIEIGNTEEKEGFGGVGRKTFIKGVYWIKGLAPYWGVESVTCQPNEKVWF